MFDDGAPIYRQIADDICAQILAGTLNDGDQVMSTAQYATTFRINPATAAKAFALLVAEGLLSKRRGVGMFVADGARSRLLREARERFYAEAVDPMVARARVLGVPLADIAAYLAALPAAAPGPRPDAGANRAPRPGPGPAPGASSATPSFRPAGAR